MRIIGSIPHPILKITVFSLDMKFAIKLEVGLMEQTYKLRQSDEVKNLKDIEKLIDEEFTNSVLDKFKEMNILLMATYKRNLE